MSVLAGIAAALAAAGVVQALAGWFLTARFAARTVSPPAIMPPITVLKPLHGNEPLLEAALTSVCEQDYPEFQVVFGVQSRDDPAVAVVQRLRARFPDIDLTVNPAMHGENRKIGNLINMLPSARHDVLVIADSDLHVQPDYLQRLAAILAQPGVGLVTTLYTGLPATTTIPAMLGATQITHGFLPGALLARFMGRRDCLGATMCLTRQTLARIGGFPALVHHLADDNVLGRRVQAQGLRVELADTVPATTVPETTLGALFRHELRWARTIRALVPEAFAASVLQYPLFWALLTLPLSNGAIWSFGTYFVVWVLRAAAAIGIDNALAPKLAAPERDRFGRPRHDQLGLVFSCPVWLLPLRDLLSVAVLLVSYAGRRVDWRGHTLQADTPPNPRPEPFRPVEGLKPR
jgi:ceramide glucosyltransferase